MSNLTKIILAMPLLVLTACDGAAEGEACATDDDCADGLVCHVHDSGEDGECESEDEDHDDDHDDHGDE